jgi:hypothetical protein
MLLGPFSGLPLSQRLQDTGIPEEKVPQTKPFLPQERKFLSVGNSNFFHVSTY